MQRILIISPEVPYPTFKGNQHRIDITIKILLSLGYKVSLAVLNSNQKERTSTSIVRDLRKEYPQLDYIEVRKNISSKNMYSKLKVFMDDVLDQGDISNFNTCPISFRRSVSLLVDKFNPTHIIVNYAKLTKSIPANYTGVRILDCHDIQTNILKESIRSGFKKESGNLEQYLNDELKQINSYDFVISINKNESIQFKKWNVEGAVLTIPAFGDVKNIYKIMPDKKYDLLFVGSASPFNVEGAMKFIAKCLPRIKKTYPNIQFAIAGDVSTCSALNKVNDPCVIKLGRVKSLEDVYKSTKVVVSSVISGAGMKVKNIEGLNFGMPIVATSFSMDGIDVVDNVSAIIRDDWNSFADAVNELLRDQKRREKISDEAFKLAQLAYSTTMATNKYKAIIDGELDLINQSTTTSLHSGNSSSVELLNNPIAAPYDPKRRIKTLIFSTDAAELIDLNVQLAKYLGKVNIYCEFLKMNEGGENRFYRHGFLVHSLRNKLLKEKRALLKNEIKLEYHKDQVSGFTYQGIDISEDINIYKEMFPSHFEKSTEDVIVHGILILNEIITLINKIKPDFLVGWNGNGPHFIFLMKVAAKVKNIPIYHVERGLLPDTFVFDPYGVNFKSNIAGSFLPLLSGDERQLAQRYIQQYRESSKTIVGAQARSYLTKAQVLRKLKLEKTANYLFFPMQIEGDSNIIINSPKYKKMRQVIDDCLEVAQKLNFYLICRPHPENKMDDIISADYQNKHLIIDNSIHIHDMLANSAANIVINSTVGLESILLGKPTIALGNSTYSGKGITFDAYSSLDILEAVNRIITGCYNDVAIERKTESLIHLLNERQLINLTSTDNNAALSNLLKVHGFYHNTALMKPAVPAKAVNYIQRTKEMASTIKSSKSSLLINCLPENTIQYLNGSKKPIITEALIKAHFNKLLGKQYEFIESTLPEINKTISAQNNQYDSILVIALTKGSAVTESKLYWLDEYFVMHD